MQLLKLQNLATIKLFNERTKLQKGHFLPALWYSVCPEMGRTWVENHRLSLLDIHIKGLNWLDWRGIKPPNCSRAMIPQDLGQIRRTNFTQHGA